ncbi:MAG: hypothetical protein DRP29_01980 [Thermodesulfobacteriota bacterium]|nr:MAG: hypothetical protein DRP29_01980 [Thermodesulfobacteriota bacterium]
MFWLSEFFNQFAMIFIVFFLWRIAAHLKGIRKSLSGKLLYDTVKEIMKFEETMQKRKKEKEVG